MQDRELWVVFEMSVRGQPSGRHAVCPQSEWAAMQSGGHRLVQDCIGSEGLAERLARGTSGDTVARVHRRSALEPTAATPQLG